MRRVVSPGSFDPVTNGHVDIIGRAARLYDEVVVAVLINISKRNLFTVDERIEMLREVTSEYSNIRVEKFHGLIVEFCLEKNIPVIVKGLRAIGDFDYELQMAQMNYRLGRRGDALHAHESALCVPFVESRQGGRAVWRRRDGPGSCAGRATAA